MTTENTEKQENENCLAGIKCPKCGHTEDFDIAIYTWVRVTDDGTEETGAAVEWDDKSPIHCRACSHAGTVKEFTVNKEE